MQWLGASASVEMTESDGELLFMIRRVVRGIDVVSVGVALCASLVCLWYQQWWVLLFTGVGGTFGLISLLHPSTGSLWVAESGIRFSQSGLIEDKSGSFRWSEIESLEYQQGGESSDSGLYVVLGRWSSRCMLSIVDQEQTDEIVHKIYSRFPYVEMKPPRSGGFFGDRYGEIITLGLSSKR